MHRVATDVTETANRRFACAEGAKRGTRAFGAAHFDDRAKTFD
jgi:hypothetical protein